MPTPVPTAAIALSSSNAQNVTGDAMVASLQTAGNTSLFAGLQLQGNPPPKTHVLSRFLEQEIGRVDQVLRSAILAATATTVNCLVSGSITIDVPSANSVSETFNACSDFAGESVSGAIVISGIASSPSTFSASVSTSLTFSVAGFADQTFTGSFAVSETGIGSTLVTIVISGAELFLHEGTNTERLGSFTLTTTIDTSTSATTDTVTLTYASTEIGGSVSVATLTPFQTSSGRSFPHAGAIQIVGANGSTARVTVNGDESGAAPQLTIQLDADGDGVFESTLNKNWSDLTA